jgi:hypothetical protein
VTVEWISLPSRSIKGHGVFEIEIDLEEVNGRYECVGIRLQSAGRRRRVDGDVLRRLRVAELVHEAAVKLEETGVADQIAADAEVWATPLINADAMSPRFLKRREDEVVKPARAEAARQRQMIREAARAGGLTRLRVAADIYKRARRRGSTSPVADVASELRITRAAAASLIRRCREADPPLIPPAKFEPTRADKTTARRPQKRGGTRHGK